VARESGLDNQWNTRLRWPAWNQTVAAFLEDTAVIHHECGKLWAVTALRLPGLAGQAAANRVPDAFSTAGLEAVVVVNEAGWEESVMPPRGMVLKSGSPAAGDLRPSP